MYERHGKVSVNVADEIENADTGEVIRFIEVSPAVLKWEATWPRRGQRVVPHVHPSMEETWTVLEGTIVVESDGRQLAVPSGRSVAVAAGVAHRAWNPGPGAARVVVEMRPALRWAEFTKRLFSGEDPLQLLKQYRAEVRLA